MNKEQINFISTHFAAIENRELTNENLNSFLLDLENQIVNINNCIENEIQFWTSPIKLIVLGEAPLSFNKFFYNKQGNFLQGFNNYYDTRAIDLKTVLRQNGIFVLDAYRFPIKTSYYDKDRGGILFETDYFNARFEYLRNIGLIDKNTKIIFRYIKLFRRDYILNNENIVNNYIKNNNNEPISLYSNGEYGIPIISTEVINFLETN